MLQVNPKAIVVAGSALFVLALGGLTYNQYQLTQRLDSQVSLDAKVLKQDQKLINTLEARLSPSPTATPTSALKEVRPTISIKATITKK